MGYDSWSNLELLTEANRRGLLSGAAGINDESVQKRILMRILSENDRYSATIGPWKPEPGQTWWKPSCPVPTYVTIISTSGDEVTVKQYRKKQVTLSLEVFLAQGFRPEGEGERRP